MGGMFHFCSVTKDIPRVLEKPIAGCPAPRLTKSSQPENDTT